MKNSTRITINTTAIPGHVRDDLAAATLDSVKAFLRQPGGQALLDARIADKKKAATQAATKGASKNVQNARCCH